MLLVLTKAVTFMMLLFKAMLLEMELTEVAKKQEDTLATIAAKHFAIIQVVCKDLPKDGQTIDLALIKNDIINGKIGLF